jgi:leucyl-tRNA synthetase
MERTSTGADKGKTGVFTGAYAVHPLSGEKLPIWIADYVLAHYGTGAVMAVPAHDDRDFEFATRFGLPIKQVVRADTDIDTDNETGTDTGTGTAGLPFTRPGIAMNSGSGLDGLCTKDANAALVAELERRDLGEGSVTYKLRDWVFSRQRYWGEPIPIYFPVDMHDPTDEAGDPRKGSPYTIRYDEPIPVADDDLPLRLPPMDDFQPGDDPQGCLARALDWRFFQKDGQWFARETNTMPQVNDQYGTSSRPKFTNRRTP